MQTLGIVANPRKTLFLEQLPSILKAIEKAGFNALLTQEFLERAKIKRPPVTILPEKELVDRCDLVVTFGGDGTVLHAVQIVRERELPILAVNVGGLGFLTEIPLEKFNQMLEKIRQNEYRIEERMLLEGRIEGNANPLFALNEISVEKGRSTRVIEIRIELDGRFFNDDVADGLIVATPTGSTGYSLSSGGPIVVPTNRCIILNPICPHSLTNRPVIISDQSQIKLQIFTEAPVAILSADGQDVREVPSRTVVEIRKAAHTARLIKHPESDFFALLRSKLRWGEDFRDKKRWSYNR